MGAGEIAEASLRFKARIAGVLYMIIIIAAAFAEVFVRGRLVVDGNAAATAANILTHQSLYRLGGVAGLIALTCDTAVALIFYELLKPVSSALSLLAAFFRLMLVAIMAVNSLNYFAPLAFLGDARFLTAFKMDQLQALAFVSQSSYAQGYHISLVFFGFHCLLIGYLIDRSAFFPRILGSAVAVAGLCYLTNSLANFLSPAVERQLFPWILLPAAAAEWGLTLWLLVRGVNVRRWKEQAASAVR